MYCPQCGYEMSSFDVECERCKRMGQIKNQPTQQRAPLDTTPAVIQTPMPDQVQEKVIMNHRSNVTAGLLALFLGGIGIHKFYNGSSAWGIIYIVSCFVIPGLSAFVALVEGIVYLCDAKKYDRTYNQEPPEPWKW
jgi:TM2 domain-containing membrane protein YozV